MSGAEADRLGAVLAILGGADPALVAARMGENAEIVAAWVARFTAAGTQALRDGARSDDWIQYHFQIDTALELAAWFASDLVSGVEALLDEGALNNFFFMRKAPGIRLRAQPVSPEAGRDFVRLMERAATALPPAWRVPYFPECHLFGGPAGMDIAHRAFTLDTLLVLNLARHAGLGERIEASAISAAVIDAMFRTVAEDEWERWGLWSSLAGMRSGQADACAPGAAAIAMARRDHASRIVALCAQASALARADRQGELTVSARSIVPLWAAFHLNRMGFPAAEQAALARGVAELLSPHRPIRRHDERVSCEPA